MIQVIIGTVSGSLIGFVLGMYFEFKKSSDIQTLKRLSENEIHLITLEIEKLRNKNTFLHDALLNQFQVFLSDKNRDIADIKGELAIIIMRIKSTL